MNPKEKNSACKVSHLRLPIYIILEKAAVKLKEEGQKVDPKKKTDSDRRFKVLSPIARASLFLSPLLQLQA